MSDIELINDEEYINRKELFRVLWELEADPEVFESLFDGNDLINYGYKIGLTQEEMISSGYFTEDDFENGK